MAVLLHVTSLTGFEIESPQGMVLSHDAHYLAMFLVDTLARKIFFI